MPTDPLVSVVIPTYNNARFVVEAVESVLAQTYDRYEVIAVDDGSTDDTLERLSRFGPPVRTLSQENQGPPFARNTGIRAGTGELVAFLDSDDLWLPDKLERSVAALTADPEAGVVYTNFRMHELETGLRYQVPTYRMSGRMAQNLFRECRGVSTSTIVCRRECFDKVGLFDEELFRAQDWDLFIRLAEAFPFRFVPEVLTERRLHAASLSIRHRDLYREYNLRVIEKAAARRPDLYGPLKPDALARAYCRFGLDAYARLDMPAARRDFLRSIRSRVNVQAADYYVRTFLPKWLIRRHRQKKAQQLDTADHE